MDMPPPTGPPASPQPPSTPAQDTTMAALAHAGGLFIGFLAPLLVYLLKEDDEFAKAHARAALNMQISYAIWFLISLVLSLIIIGLVGFAVFGIMYFVCQIIGAVKASNNEMYAYPLTITFLK